MTVVSVKKLSALLALLYAAPLDDSLWQPFLTELCGQLQARQCFYVRAETPTPPHIVALGGPPLQDDLPERYNEQYGSIDPYGPALAPKARTAPIIAEEVVSRTELERTDFHNLVLQPNELHHAVFLPAILCPDHFDAFTIWRSIRQKPFDENSAQFLELLLPHLQSALRTRRALTADARRAIRSEGVLDALGTPAILLDSQAKLVHCNAAAEKLLRAGDGVLVREGRLVASNHESTGRLRALIKGAIYASGAALSLPGGAIMLPRSAGRRPLHVLVSPLRLEGMPLPAHAIVVLSDPERQTTFSKDVLRTLYQLTPSEAEIANALAYGHSVAEIADLRRVSPGTLRIQLKAIFQKTATRRQSELMRLLLVVPQVQEP